MSEYTGRLRIRFDPFDNTAEPSVFYQGGNRQLLLDQLIQLSCYSSDIAIVTGALGSGKSTLSHVLAQSLDDDFIVVCVQASLFMDHLQLLEAIGRGLDLDVAQLATTDELSNAIANYAGFMADKSKTVQIIIDDAHELSGDALHALLSLVERQADTAVLGDGGIKAVLLGEGQLFNTLGQLPPITATKVELEPLTREGAVDYIQFKLSTAGFSGNFPFDAETMAAIDERSNGMPGAINSLISDELGQYEFESSIVPKLHVAERHLVAASLVFAAVVLGLFVFVGSGEDEVPSITTAATQESSDNRVQVPLDVNSVVREQEQTSEIASIADEPLESTVEPVVEITEAVPLIADTVTEVMEQVQVDETTISGESLIQATPSPVLIEVVDTEIEESDVVITPNEVVIQNSIVEPSNSLLNLPTNSYTLQLLGSRSETNVRNFISDNGGGDNYAYFETQFQEKPWYVVVYGNYPDSISAKAAIANLPGSLNELEPWARSVSEIQQAIRSNQ
jgi:DamX protein